jgi:hypothetical protein
MQLKKRLKRLNLKVEYLFLRVTMITILKAPKRKIIKKKKIKLKNKKSLENKRRKNKKSYK